jgi:hypothetical protein
MLASHFEVFSPFVRHVCLKHIDGRTLDHEGSVLLSGMLSRSVRDASYASVKDELLLFERHHSSFMVSLTNYILASPSRSCS